MRQTSVSPTGGSPHSLFSSLRKGPLRICILGAGNWASAVATLVCPNAEESYLFHNTVLMWVFDELVNDKMLSQHINENHENVKYLPNVKLPENLVACPDLLQTVRDADLLIFVLPHQFVLSVCERIRDVVKLSAKAITLVKGLHVDDGVPVLFSDVISEILKLDCSALSGANVAKDIAHQEFSESTIGYTDPNMAAIWQQLFNRPHFRVACIPDVCGLQVCGAVKNVVALAAGFCDGMQLGTNAKSAIIRIGIEEMRLFSALFFDGVLENTFFSSAGVADVITTCFGGRNVKCAAEFVRRGGGKMTSWEAIETELLHGQKMQGHLSCKEVYEVVSRYDLQAYFPLFVATYEVACHSACSQTIFEPFMSIEPMDVQSSTDVCVPVVVPKSLLELKIGIRRAREMSRKSLSFENIIGH